MVAVIDPAELRKAFYYNEHKCTAGKAICLYAHMFPNEAALLSEREKLMRMRLRAALNPGSSKNTLHISINFHPSESFEKGKLLKIVQEYMELIGYGNQPYLAYQHFDTAHPHVHIVASCIQANGVRKKTQFIGRDISMPATRFLENKYGLFPAEQQERAQAMVLAPVDLQAVLLGKTPTKAAISKVVRSVIHHYNFTSLVELNAILNQFNVTVDRGQVGSRMFEKRGLQYSAMLPTGKKVGVPIKASSIFGKPTMTNLERLYNENKQSRKSLKGRARRIIQDILQQKPDLETFVSRLADEHIKVILRENEDGYVYGITFVDNVSLCVFNGRELGKSYGAAGILKMFSSSDDHPSVRLNSRIASDITAEIGRQRSVRAVLKTLAMKGVAVVGETKPGGKLQFTAGHIKTDPAHFCRLDPQAEKYFRASGMDERGSQAMLDGLQLLFPPGAFGADGQDYFPLDERVEALIEGMFDSFFAYTDEPYERISRELLKEAKRKRKRKRRQ